MTFKEIKLEVIQECKDKYWSTLDPAEIVGHKQIFNVGDTVLYKGYSGNEHQGVILGIDSRGNYLITTPDNNFLPPTIYKPIIII
jgi:hypothetical protein